MNVAITAPTTWPRVRRGAERFTNELAGFLGTRGHRVTLVSAKPGRPELVRHEGYTTVCRRRLWHPALAKIGVLEFHTFMLPALVELLKGDYDVVLSSTFIDAYAAILARRFTGAGCVFWVNGLAPRIRYVRSVTLRGAVFRRAVQQSDDVIALSRFMQADLGRRFGREGTCMPVPVDTARFRLSHARASGPPVILCAAALDDPRKGGRLLLRAFGLLKERRPDVVLQLSSAISGATRGQLLELVPPRWRSDVHFLGAGELEDLPALFGRASVSVLPSLWEPFGMVLLESLATGTPVVGTRDGAIPEIVTDPAVGRLFDPGPPDHVAPSNVGGLVDALDDGLDLSRRPETAPRCRAHAERFSWNTIGPGLEALLQRVARPAMHAEAS